MARSSRLSPPLPFPEQVAIFTRLEEANPHPETELNFVNPFTLVVAVALSAQATDIGVNKATKGLFAVADTPQKMLDLGLEGVTEHIRTIGLYRQKAKNVIALSRILVQDYGGAVPDSRAALMSLPGVGRKTANVVLNCAFGQPSHAPCTGPGRGRCRTCHRGQRARPVSAACPSLADPAWALYLSGTAPALCRLHHQRSLPL